jgi:hypothetical protein
MVAGEGGRRQALGGDCAGGGPDSIVTVRSRRMSAVDDVDDELAGWLERAYDRA